MLKILSVSQNYHLTGGSDQVFFRTNAILSENGHTVIPFAAASPKNQPSEWSAYFPPAADFEHPGPADLARYLYSPAAARAIRRVIADHHPDIAHLHIYYGKLTGSILAPLKKAGIPIVQTLHEYKLVCPVYTLVSNGEICEACQGRHFYQALPRRCNRGSLARTALSVAESYVSRWAGSISKVDHFIAVSHFMRGKMIELGVPAEKITTVYNFVDISTVEPNPEPGGYLLYFGRIERIKGLLTLLEAAAPLTHLPLKIAGDGNARDEVQALIREKNLAHVEYLGFQSGTELYDLIHNSLAVIVPSEWYETFGLTIVEGFAHARPVIGSRIGAIPELIDEGRDGFLVPPGDVSALREKLLEVAENPEAAARMGQAGRQKVESLFTSQRYYQELMAVYGRFTG
ncbi:MAG: glycosyltransferase family 4 protein [Chloroflexota bacterium]